MKIRYKLTLAFVGIALIVAAVGYLSIHASQKALQESIGEYSAILADETLSFVDRDIYHRIEQVWAYSKDLAKGPVLLKSNQEFDRLDNVQEYIDRNDRAWKAAQKEEITPFMQRLINNELSQEIRDELELKQFNKQQYGYPVFAEIFVTNKYGANVAQTGKTFDYYQADEDWWRAAKQDEVYVSQLKYDRSANTYALSLAVAIYEPEEVFAGVIKAVLNIQEVINIIQEAERASEFHTTEFKLLTKDGRIIYSTEKHEFLESFPDELVSRFHCETDEHTNYFIAAGNKPGEGEELFAHASSSGYKDFRGLGWLLVVEYETEEIFAPIAKLKACMFIISTSLVILAVLVGLLISSSISKPIAKLSAAATEIGRGNLRTQVKIKSNDEIAALGRCFNTMVSNLREITASRNALNSEIAARRQAQEQLSVANTTLEKRVSELAEAREAALNMMEDAEQARQDAEEAGAKLEQVNLQLETSVEKANLLAKEAFAANKAKDDFLANMSHEIRTPMNSVIGFSEVLDEQGLTDEQRNHVNIIRESAEDLLTIINDILDLSKIEAGKLDVKLAECSLQHLLVSLDSLLRPPALEKGLEFEIRPCGRLPAQIRTDYGRLRQCLINLVANAVKFTEEGYVHLNISAVQVDKKAFILFDVEDTGVGIPAEKQEMMFEAFEQAESGTSRKYGGTGLGLAITKRFTELLGGRLTLTSEAAKGSTFSITIPAGLDIESQPPLDENILMARQKQPPMPLQDKFFGSVLVVEDSESNRRLIRLLLEKLGLNVTIAEDGRQAVNKALSQAFDLVLMDMQMPNMDGYEATRTLHQQGIKTPIVALTAYTMTGDDKKCISAGCNDYLAKPLDRRKLVKTLRKYLPSESESAAGPNPPQQGPEKHPEPPNDADIIDWTAVTNICSDEDVIKSVADAILQDGPDCIEHIDSALQSQNHAHVRLYAHRLKGAALTIGAGHLADTAYAIESAGDKQDIAASASLFGQLKTEFQNLQSFLSQPDWIQKAKQQQTIQSPQQLETI